MDDQATTLDVSILGREYRVGCKQSERDELLLAVQLLDRRMREIRDSGKIAGTERIAVMAALNIAHELLQARAGHVGTAGAAGFDSAGVRRRISAMQSAIDRAMADQDKLF
ncbi:MAG TPA: cell division protein ZapA [Casimicrobiaceae bacterium]|jgi:cell division protein ZapA|nr:cell division protein ZapA [Casimicrobiaceae bacterium]